MPKSPFEPCIPTPGTKVPDSKNWIHEIKHDGYRLIVQRKDQRVRLWTRNGLEVQGSVVSSRSIAELGQGQEPGTSGV